MLQIMMTVQSIDRNATNYDDRSDADDDDDFTVKVVDGPEADHYQYCCKVADEEPWAW